MEPLPQPALDCLKQIAKHPGIKPDELAKILNGGRLIPTRQTLSYLLWAGQIISDGSGFYVMPVAKDD